MTPSATRLLAQLRERQQRFEEQVLTAGTDNIKRNVAICWRDACEAAIRDLEYWLPKVEAEAFLVPDPEPQYGSLRERLMAEEGLHAA